MTEIPSALRARYRGHDWRAVDLGESGASVYRLSGPSELFVKVAPDVHAEASRLEWLASCGIPVPAFVEAGRDEHAEWLVSAALRGVPASSPWTVDDLPRVIDSIADATRALHALDIATCPFDRSFRVTLDAAHAAASGGAVDLDDLDDERRGWSAQQLLAELERTRPCTEDLVVCHGDLCLPNVIIDPRTFRVAGFVDVGRAGIADRYSDLALIARSLAHEPRNAHFGPSLAERFFRAYGEPRPDPARVAFYCLLDEFF